MRQLPDWAAARIRTVWPMVVGYVAARLIVVGAPVATWLERNLGLQVTEPQVAVGVGIILGYLVYEAGRWLERRRGTGWRARFARGAGRWLLSLGLPTGQPTYLPQRPGGLLTPRPLTEREARDLRRRWAEQQPG